MPDGSIKIRIGAASDRSIDVVFGNLEKRAQKARDTIARLFGANTSGKSFQGVATEAEKSFARVEKSAEKSANARVRSEERANREIVKAFQRASADADREIAKQTKSAEREAAKQARVREKFADRTSHRATRFLFPPPTGLIGGASRLASDMLRGAGVDLSVNGSVDRVVKQQTSFAALENQARVAGKPLRGSGRDEIKTVADKYGFSRAEATSAVAAYATKTGDANAGLDALDDLAKRAAASGTNFTEMADAAADVANGLGNVPNKSKAMIAAMDTFTVQGAEGAVEIKQLAREMPKLTASAGRYTGDTAGNLSKLGALAQVAREKGGATSAAEAANAVSRLTDQFSTPARLAAFKKAGINVIGKDNQIRDPFALIREAISKTGGDPEKMSGLIKSTVAAKATRGFTSAYNQAGGGEAGMRAVDDLLAKYMKGKLSSGTLDQNVASRDDTIAVKAQKFNNKLDDITEKMGAKLFPALEKLEGPAIRLAQMFTNLVSAAADNPWTAVALAAAGALSASIARAGLESLLRAGIERMLSGSPMPFSGGAGGAGSIAGRGLGVLGATAVGGMAGAAIGELGGDARGGALVGGSLGALSQGGLLGTGTAAALGAGAAYDQNQKLKQENAGLGIGDMIGGLLTTGKGYFTQVDEENNRKAKADAAQRAVSPEQAAKGNQKPNNLDANELGMAVATGIGTKTLNVRITNPGDIKGPVPPTVSPNGRGEAAGAPAR